MNLRLLKPAGVLRAAGGHRSRVGSQWEEKRPACGDSALPLSDSKQRVVSHNPNGVSYTTTRKASQALKEFLVFSRLARNADRVVLSEDIWRSACGDPPFNSLSLRVHIHRLRRTFQPFGLRIESMVGVGYCLSVDQTGRVKN